MADSLHKAVMDKKPVPEIDFTLHIMEDGTQVSTQERVCKGITPDIACHLNMDILTPRQMSKPPPCSLLQINSSSPPRIGPSPISLSSSNISPARAD